MFDKTERVYDQLDVKNSRDKLDHRSTYKWQVMQFTASLGSNLLVVDGHNSYNYNIPGHAMGAWIDEPVLVCLSGHV